MTHAQLYASKLREKAHIQAQEEIHVIKSHAIITVPFR